MKIMNYVYVQNSVKATDNIKLTALLHQAGKTVDAPFLIPFLFSILYFFVKQENTKQTFRTIVSTFPQKTMNYLISFVLIAESSQNSSPYELLCYKNQCPCTTAWKQCLRVWGLHHRKTQGISGPDDFLRHAVKVLFP